MIQEKQLIGLVSPIDADADASARGVPVRQVKVTYGQ
jgi:hypothetical protein